MITLSKNHQICKNCGEKYLQTSLRQFYCGTRKDKKSCSFLVKKEQTKLYLRKNKDRIRELGKSWRTKNREIINANNKLTYKEKHPPKIIIPKTKEEKLVMGRIRNIRYYNKNRARIMEKLLVKRKEKLIKVPEYKEVIKMKYLLWNIFKLKRKSDTYIGTLGCTPSYLRRYIEKQFKEGMSWNNYGRGGWVVDHIIPLKTIDFNDKNSFLTVCNYRNLQPLWELENGSKSSKIL